MFGEVVGEEVFEENVGVGPEGGEYGVGEVVVGEEVVLEVVTDEFSKKNVNMCVKFCFLSYVLCSMFYVMYPVLA